MFEYVKQILTGQYEASLAMLGQCIERCPAEHWNGKIAKYEFWHVAYHALCCTDGYLAPSHDAFEPCEFHPKGLDEMKEEYPSREMTQQELTGYTALCRERAVVRLAGETEESLKAPSGFSWLGEMTRGELHIYNIRHLMHHTGHLGGYLRKAGVDTEWVKTGWG